MFDTSRRLTARSDFSRALQGGVRVKERDLVAHVLVLPGQWPDPSGLRPDVATSGGPRFGFIVSKKVGNSVTRHAVTRRLRAACATAVSDLAVVTDAYIVVRAFSSARDRSVLELIAQISAGLRRAGATGELLS